MGFLGLEETLDRLAKAKVVQWCGQVLRTENQVLQGALDFEVVGRRECG